MAMHEVEPQYAVTIEGDNSHLARRLVIPVMYGYTRVSPYVTLQVFGVAPRNFLQSVNASEGNKRLYLLDKCSRLNPVCLATSDIETCIPSN